MNEISLICCLILKVTYNFVGFLFSTSYVTERFLANWCTPNTIICVPSVKFSLSFQNLIFIFQEILFILILQSSSPNWKFVLPSFLWLLIFTHFYVVISTNFILYVWPICFLLLSPYLLIFEIVILYFSRANILECNCSIHWI